MVPESRCEDRSAIGNNGIWETMKGDNVVQEHTGELGSVGRFIARDEVGHLGETVDEDEEGVIGIRHG